MPLLHHGADLKTDRLRSTVFYTRNVCCYVIHRVDIFSFQRHITLKTALLSGLHLVVCLGLQCKISLLTLGSEMSNI